MIWRSLIFSSLLAWPCCASTVSGKVVLQDSRLRTVKRERNYSGVVISLSPVNRSPDPQPPRHFRMLQKRKTFTPHVLPIPTGSIVDFPNADPIFHNAFSSYNGQIFDVGLYPPGTNRSVRFTRAGVVRVFCNIHASMSAVILVLDTPYFAATGDDGSFRIDAPPGDYNLSVFHERATEAVLDRLGRRISVGNDPVAPPGIIISESGYVVASHNNKYGKSYPPGSGDDVMYPGARK